MQTLAGNPYVKNTLDELIVAIVQRQVAVPQVPTMV